MSGTVARCNVGYHEVGQGVKSGDMNLHHDGLPQPQRGWAILTIAIGLIMAVMDGAIANVALPTIAHELNATAASSIWIVNAYQLAITVTLLPLAALGDRLGYRRVYMVGLAVFPWARWAARCRTPWRASPPPGCCRAWARAGS